MKRPGQPNEVAPAFMFLACEDSSYMAGQVLHPNGGTVVNIVLKQGTNQFHGSGWWYGQRSATDARDFFNTGEKPDHVRDQYGFAVGGPIVKSKLFYSPGVIGRSLLPPVKTSIAV